MIGDVILWFFLFVVLGYLFDKYIKWHLFPKRWGVVEVNSIFRSGQLSPFQIKKQVRKHKIDVIVSLMSPVPGNLSYEAEQRIIKTYGLDQYVYPLLGDGTGDIQQYAAAIAKINDSVRDKKVVLVHCAAGTQRTGGVVASYRMLVQGVSPDQAALEMKRYGWRHKKNPVLVPFINQHLSELEILLIEKKILDDIRCPLPVLPHKN